MATQTGYKASELGMIPLDWDVVELGKVIKSITSGVSVNSIDEINKFAHGYHVLKTSCVANGYFDSSYAKSILPNEIFRAKNSVKKGNLIVSRMNTPLLVGELGYTKKDEPKIFLPDRLWQVEIKEDLANTQFLSFLLSYPLFAKVLKETATGTSDSMKNISKNNFSSLNIYLPPLSEQIAIATALSDTDTLISSLQTLIAKKQAIKLSAMQNLLSGKIRLPEFAQRPDGLPKIMRQTELGCVPEDWEVVELGSVAFIKTGSKNNQDKKENGQYPFFVRSANVEQIDSYSYDCEAILIPGEGNIGSIFHYINGKFDAHQRVYVIRDFKNVIGKFVFFALKQSFGKHAMENTVKATVDSLRLPTFQNFKFAIPKSTTEQTAIAQLLSDMDAEIEALECRLKKTQSLKQGMMQALLTGKIRLPLE